MSRQEESILQFFKVFDATKYSNQLHIPTSFISYMQGNLPNQAFLSDKFGNMWPIKLAKIESMWYFEKGWAKVVQDNSLEHKSTVIFQFDGDKTFYFRIIGKDSCNEEGVGSLMFILDNNEVENDEENGKSVAEESNLSQEGSRKFQRGSDEGRKKAAAEVGRKQKAFPDLYGAEMIRSGLLLQPKNPYFVAKIKPNRSAELFIPGNVIKDFKLTLPQKIILRDPNGRTWLLNLIIYKDGRTSYTAGSRSFCFENLIGPEDKCICEFLLEQQQPVIQIQIVRSENVKI